MYQQALAFLIIAEDNCRPSQEDSKVSLRQIIYVSLLSESQDPSCISDILRESQSNNADNHVTGMLLYVNGSFLQVLEGNRETLQKLYTKICADPRHSSAVKILDHESPERDFPRWSMGHAEVTTAEIDKLSGLNDFFSRGHCLTELDEGIVRRVLTEFRQGQWRNRLT